MNSKDTRVSWFYQTWDGKVQVDARLLCDFSRFLGQENLLNSSVLIVGCGGLGCPVIQYLAAAGIGRIGVVDFDTGKNCHVQDFVSELAEKR